MHSVGKEIEQIERERQPAGVMMIPIPRSGILREVRGLEEASRVSGITDITIRAALGKPLVPLPEGSKYLGFIFARAATLEAVEAALRRAHSQLAFEVESGPSR